MPVRAPGRFALAFVLITVFIDVVGFGIILPVLPELIMELTGEGLSSAVTWGGYLLFIYALMQFIFAPVIGNLSDHFGRRPVLLLSLLAFGIDYMLMGFAPTITWLFIGRMFAGLFGSSGATANAFIADVSSDEKRAQNFGLVGAAFGLGFVVGPVIGGFLGELGPRVPFFAAAALALANTTYGFIVLPETLSKENRRPFSLARANPIGAFQQMRSYPIVLGILGVIVFYHIAHDANPSTWTYYTMLKFEWSERDIGFSLGFVGLMMAIVQGGLVRLAIPKLGERRTTFLGLGFAGIGFAGFAFASEGWMMYVWMVPFALMGLAMPAMRGIMANAIPENSQGELQGAITSLASLTAIVAPLMMTRAFAWFTRPGADPYFPGAAFFLAACLMVVSVFMFTRALRRTASVTLAE